MALSLSEVKALCTASEFAVVEASRSPSLEKLSASDLKKNAQLARKLFDKWQGQSRKQARASSQAAGFPDTDTRSNSKTEVFREALDALEGRLNSVEASSGVKAAVVKGTPKIERSRQTRIARQDTKKQLHNTKKKLNAASKTASAAVAAAAPAAAPAVVAAAPAKKVAKGPKKKLTPAQRAVKKANVKRTLPKPAAIVKTTTKSKTKTGAPLAVKGVVSSAASRPAVVGKAKQNTLKISNKTSNIAGHVSAKGKRAQAKRDRKGK
jgi:hypothetical protein